MSESASTSEEPSKKRLDRFFEWGKDKLLAPVLTLILGTFLGSWWNSASPDLRFSVGEPIEFSGEKEQFGLLVVRVSNVGRKQAENVKCMIDLPECEIQDLKVAPSIVESQQKISGGNAVISLTSLNPNESVELAVKASNPHLISKSQKVSLRGEGVNGVQGIKSDSVIVMASALTFLILVIGFAASAFFMAIFGPWIFSAFLTVDTIGERLRDSFRKKKCIRFRSFNAKFEKLTGTEAESFFKRLGWTQKRIEYQGLNFKLTDHEVEDGTAILTFTEIEDRL